MGRRTLKVLLLPGIDSATVYIKQEACSCAQVCIHTCIYRPELYTYGRIHL